MKSYESIKALNWSSLKEMYISPFNFLWKTHEPRKDEAFFSLGRIIHLAILEPEKFVSKCVSRPEQWDSWRTVASREWKKEQLDSGKEVMTEKDAQVVKNVIANFLNHPDSKILEKTLCEQIIEWKDRGVKCKGRVDAVSSDRIIDLKTTTNLFDFIRRDFFRYLYHGQLAWYLNGAISSGLTSKDSETYVIACETSPPYDVAIFRLGDEVLTCGQALKNQLLETWVACKSANFWPGIYPNISEILDVPPWAPGQERFEEDI